MDTLFKNNNEDTKSGFDVLSFERKLVELVEELRLRRNLEIEGEKTLKSFMDEKYKSEMEWDEKYNMHIRERTDLEQQIIFLKRKLEDKVCVSDDEKAKQQVVNKTYSQEIRVLKEELRNANSEKLNLVKRIQELEGQLKLHSNFQETIVSQIDDIRRLSKRITDEFQELAKVQKTVLDNVSEVKNKFKKYDICNQHLQQCIEIAEKKNEGLKKELISTRSEVTVLKNASIQVPKNVERFVDSDKLQSRNLELEKCLLLSRKENQKTLQNLVESNRQLSRFMNKYADAKELEKSLTAKIVTYEDDMSVRKYKTEELRKELARMKEQERKKEHHTEAETQTGHLRFDFRQRDGTSDMPDLLEANSDSHAFETVCHTKVNSSNEGNEGASNVIPETTDKEMPCLVDMPSFRVQNEIGTCGEILKRKFSMIEEEGESNAAETSKKHLSNMSALGAESNWTIENKIPRMGRKCIDDDKSIPSSFNSVDDLCQSQDNNSQENGAAVSINSQVNAKVDVDYGGEGSEVEMSDLASVQMNLKELKVHDTGLSTNKEDEGNQYVEKKLGTSTSIDAEGLNI